ncbi:DUF3892 domain-containing protein [Oerskovia sp. NPDC060287]|uniref:DUF3892 domain-containing protein n=1 Tax=Oerskovia sp. NPDC060287 TaxID=3347095 RepID=UPI003666D964
MNYLRSVRVAHPGTSSQHITELGWSTTTTGQLSRATRDQVHTWITSGHAFRSLSPQGTQADVVARTSPSGTRYVATVADGRETNNLLNLPRF